MKHMIDKIMLCFALLIVLSVFASSPVSVHEDYYRLRILANSDSPEDQQMKLEIRDRIIEMTHEELTGKKTKAAAREYISQNLKTIKSECNRIVHSYDKDYDVRLTQDDVYFPQKTYGKQIYPSGKYEALKVEIGEAKGNNWWCVMYPPLCIVAFESDEVADGEIECRSFIVEKIKALKEDKKENGEAKKGDREIDIVDGTNHINDD